MAPNGRTANPAANVKSAITNALPDGNEVKKCSAMIEARDPYKKKSYHSNTVPKLEAIITRA